MSSLTQFCCCCDLRRGCIVFTWLQMMLLTTIIGTLIACSDVINTTSISWDLNTQNYGYVTLRNNGGEVTLALKIIVSCLFIKAASCFSLIWGIVKKNHLFFQPWIFISCIEASLISLSSLIFFILGCIITPFFLLGFFGGALIAALYWYFWVCVYTIYRKDLSPTGISYELHDALLRNNE